MAAPQSAAHRQRHNASREHWQIAGRRMPGVSSAALRHRALQQKVLMRGSRAFSAPTGGISGAWVSLGPLPLPSDASGIGLQDYNWVSGRATAVAIDPNDPTGNTMYAGGAYGGVWKSTNAGNLSPSPVSVNWTSLTDNEATLAIGAIAIQKQLANPNPANSVVLAGTGETNSSGDSYYGLGILRSADGGQNWTLISQDSTGTHSFAGLGFSQIAFSTGNPNLVVAAAGSATEGIAEGLENPLTTNRGLYYSADAGVNWQAANVADSGAPTAPASVTSVVYNSVAGMFYAAIRFHGIYSSPDGASWTRLSNQPGSGLITVFASSTGTLGWTEVGPSAGQQGFLPNVAVTSLKIFNAAGLKRLRAGTYGRGIWEWNLITTPDFQLSVANNPITVFPGQTASFGGSISALNGYNAGVNLGCASGVTSPPQTCSISPALLLPTPAGTAFSVNAGDNAADYVFNVHAVGLDPLAVTHDLSLTLHVIDFSLSTPSPASVSVTPGNATVPISFLVSSLGAFNATVTVSCSGLPAGASCQFQPSSSVVPVSGNPVVVTLNISTGGSTPIGTSSITIGASTPGEPAKSQTLTLIVGAAPDYSLAIANPSIVGSVNVPANFNGTLTGANGYSSAVTLSCGAGAPPSCVANPASITPTTGGSPFKVTVSTSMSQNYSFNIVGVGSDPSVIMHSAPVTFTALPNQNFDFTIATIPPTSATVPAGQAASFRIDVNPTTGTFPNDVSFSCSKLPALSTCVFNPAQVRSGSVDSPVSLTIQTTAAIPRTNMTLAMLMFSIVGILSFARANKRVARTVNGAATLLFLLLFTSCGGGLQGGGGNGSPGTPAGTYSITITATSGSVTHNTPTPLSLTVTP